MSLPDHPLRILLVDDNADHRALVMRELRRQFVDIQITEATGAHDLALALAENTFDLVITDYLMQNFDGLSALRMVRLRAPDCPVIMFTGTGSEEVAVLGMKAGLEDYVLKSPHHFALLPMTVRSVLERVEQRKLLRKLEEDLRQSQDNYRHAQKMEAIGRLASAVAHDFNNLITGILGYSELFLFQLAQDHPLRGEMLEIRKAAERAASLTRQLLTFSRRQPVELKLLSLNESVLGIEKMLRYLMGENIDLVVRNNAKLDRVRADSGQLEQVLMNLCVNARDAMPRGGRLTIETADSELDDQFCVRHPGLQPGPYVLLRVSDTGLGMDEATLSHIFEPYFTTKAPGYGTGLGLSTVYGIIHQGGGHIEVHSSLNQGTSFEVYLPRVAEPASAPANDAAPSLPLRGTESVLLVEDASPVRDVARAILELNGYTVLTARDGLEALQLWQRLGPTIELLMADVVLPGMSGIELAHSLVAQRPDLKVLYTSGYTDDPPPRPDLDRAGSGFLQKPFRADALLRKVRELLDGHGSSGDA